MNTLQKRLFGSKEGLLGTLFLALILVVVLPLTLDIFRLNLMGKYLTYAFVAVGLVLLWGNAGVLSLGQGVFFGLGGYCMAMFLKLEASDPITTKIQSTPGIPDFMDWNQITALPAFWVPFKSFPFATLAILIVPAVIAYVVGAAMFKRRVGGASPADATASPICGRCLAGTSGRRSANTRSTSPASRCSLASSCSRAGFSRRRWAAS